MGREKLIETYEKTSPLEISMNDLNLKHIFALHHRNKLKFSLYQNHQINPKALITKTQTKLVTATCDRQFQQKM